MRNRSRRVFLARFAVPAIVAVSLWLGGPAVSAQPLSDYVESRLPVNSMLSSQNVISIIQGKDGCIWFGTDEGIDKYDGYDLKHVRMSQECRGYDQVRTMCLDLDGNVWVGSFNGLCVCSPDGNTVRKYSEGAVASIVSSKDGAIWVAGNYAGFLRIDPATDQCDTLRFEYDSPSAHFGSGVCYDGDETIYFLNGIGTIYRVKLTDRELEVVVPGAEGPFFMLHISNIFYHDGYILGGAPQKMISYNLADKTWTFSSWSHFYCAAFFNGVLYFGDDDGLHSFDGAFHALANEVVNSLCMDRDGGLWVGTGAHGVYHYAVNRAKLQRFGYREDMAGMNVRSFLQTPDGIIWIGTTNYGLVCFNPATGTLHQVTIPSDNKEVLGIGLIGDQVMFGVNSVDAPMYAINYKTGKITSYPFTPPLVNGFLPQNEDGSRLFVTSFNRVSDVDMVKGTAVRYEKVRTTPHDFLKDGNGTLWVPTITTGLWSFDGTTWTPYTPENGISAQLRSVEVVGNNLWLGTKDTGLQCLNIETGEVRNYLEFAGNPTNVLRDISADNDGIIWICCTQGLASIDTQTLKTAFYSEEDGFPKAPNGYFGAYCAPDSTMYIGYDGGFFRFSPSSLRMNHSGCGDHKPIVNSISITGTLDGSDSYYIKVGKQVRLHANENSLEVRVSNFDYSIPRSTSMAYQLEGYSLDWQPIINGKIVITNLSSGKYVLKLRTVDKEGTFMMDGESIAIEVRPPALLSPLAFVIYLALLVLGILLLSDFLRRRANRKAFAEARVENERKEAERERMLYSSKVEFLINIAHEIRTPLALVKAPAESLREKLDRYPDVSVKEDLETMSRNSEKLSSMLDELLDLKKLESKAYKVNLQEVDLSEILHSVSSRFTSAFARKGLAFSLMLPDSPVFVSVDTQAMDKVFGNLLSNALKYAATRVLLKLSTDDDSATVVMENDGAIVPLSMREKIFLPFERFVSANSTVSGTGIGLYSSRNLVQLHSGTLVMDQDESVNRFIMTVPYSRVGDIPPVPEGVLQENVKDDRDIVFVIEDNDDMREFIDRQLRDTYRVVTAASAVDALNILNGFKGILPDVFISDVMLPGMDGYEFCRTIKKDLRYSHIPVILLTARVDTMSKIIGYEAGADSYIPKPFSVSELLAQIGSQIKNHKAIQTKFMSSDFAEMMTVIKDSPDVVFMKSLDQYISDHLDDENLSVEKLADAMCLSVSSLFKKIKVLIGIGPGEYITLTRLKKAAYLLHDKSIPIVEIANMTGFRSQSYFSTCFKSQFGITPKEYRSGKTAKLPDT